ncbi:hypothetical protein H0V99_02815 [Candidatus Saccharibacteria bacterium]|nr:hypothetical protein [Candidatus Saccharibacteria bacterium]
MSEKIQVWKQQATVEFREKLQLLGRGFAQLELLKELKGELGVEDLLLAANTSYGAPLDARAIAQYGIEAAKANFYPRENYNQDSLFAESIIADIIKLEKTDRVIVENNEYIHRDFVIHAAQSH